MKQACLDLALRVVDGGEHIDQFRAQPGQSDRKHQIVPVGEFEGPYPNSRRLRGAEWEASGEKRYTLQLLRSALALRGGGYRAFPGFNLSLSL